MWWGCGGSGLGNLRAEGGHGCAFGLVGRVHACCGFSVGTWSMTLVFCRAVGGRRLLSARPSGAWGVSSGFDTWVLVFY